ncbi:MAG: glycerate kinase [Gammaproteobacteria bacterium]
MKIVIAPDSFKGSLSAKEAAASIAKGFSDVFPAAEIVQLPIADGGEGTTETLVAATTGQLNSLMVSGPLGDAVNACWGLLGNSQIAVVEVAAACGLDMLDFDERNPMLASSYGLGEMILAALDHGAHHFIVGLGGSACNDGGAGMLQALGVRLLDAEGDELNKGGGSLSALSCIDTSSLDGRLQNVSFKVACDVDNPLIGEQGASAIFGPQKGADAQMVAELDASLAHYAKIVHQTTGKEVARVPGAGAAGGLGAAFLAFLNAELKSGIDIVLDALNFESHLENADLLITGEGRIDSQSLHGKAPIGIAKRAKQHQCLVFVIAGSVEGDVGLIKAQGIDAVYGVVSDNITLEEALTEPSKHLTSVSRKVAQGRLQELGS